MPLHETVVRAGIGDAVGCLWFAFVLGYLLYRLATTRTDRGFLVGTDRKPALGTVAINVPAARGVRAVKVEISIGELEVDGPRTFGLDLLDATRSKKRFRTIHLRQDQVGEVADALEQALGALENPRAFR